MWGQRAAHYATPPPIYINNIYKQQGSPAVVTRIKSCLDLNFFLDFDTVALSFLFDKNYPIMEQLGLNDSSRDLQINCVISYIFFINI